MESERLTKVLRALTDDPSHEVRPILDTARPEGYVYPSLQALGKGVAELRELLEELAKEGVLTRRLVHQLLLCPKEGAWRVRAAVVCPSCGSEDLEKARLVEHLRCGHIGPETEFESARGYVCPKCHRDLKLIGKDYRKPGDFFRCNACREVAYSPGINLQCLTCDNRFTAEEAQRLPLYAYRLRGPNGLRALKPIYTIAEFLRGKGYEVRTHARVPGKSGVEHEVDIVAEGKQGNQDLELIVGVAVEAPQAEVNRLIELQAKATDIGTRTTVFLAIPRMAEAAKQYAAFHRVHYFEAPDEEAGLAPFLQFLGDLLGQGG